MLDPAKPQPIDLKDFSSYITSCLALAAKKLKGLDGPEAVARAETELNAYPRLNSLEEPRDIFVVDQQSLTDKDHQRAVKTLLQGGVLLEHACAGEATRLGLGTKYLINPRLDLSPKALDRLLAEGATVPVAPDSLRSITLGRRHMLQLAWDLSRLARDAGKDPVQVLKRQRLLVVVNEASYQTVLEDFLEANFYGFQRHKTLFMVQKAFHGITIRDRKWVYDTSSERRLHNHGQMLMQTTMDNQVFRLDETNHPYYLTWPEFSTILSEYDDKVSFNIEDLDYLGQSLDLTGLAASLKLAGEGVNMVMEVVANDSENPIKGGMCAWDPKLGRNVVIESFQLAGIANEKITFLNKNINHYPRPVVSATAVREQGLSMPLTVKKGFVYFQPVQGDVNFLVPTAFLRRTQLKPINSWKSGEQTPAALEAMAAQEKRKGFIKWACDLTGLKL
ncbi:MAG: hypothetical protein PVG60_01330 [Desulfarculaceae bacterium]|jgi:hypothetical protein